MRQLQLVAHGEPSDVIELSTVPDPALGPEDVLISMEAAPLNQSDFLFVRGMYGIRREEAAEQVRQWGRDRVVFQGDNLHKDIEEALNGKKLSLVLDMVGGSPVGELAKSLKPGGSIVVYALQGGQFPAMPPKEFIYGGLSLHGFWLINWIRNAPHA